MLLQVTCDRDNVTKKSKINVFHYLSCAHSHYDYSTKSLCACLWRADLFLRKPEHSGFNPRGFSGKTWLPKHCITHPTEPQLHYPFCKQLSRESR